MSNDNVISLGSRKPLAEVQAEEAKIAAAEAEMLSTQRAEAKRLTLESIDAIRAAVEADKVGGLVMITQNLTSKIFMSDVVIDRAVITPDQLFAWTGIMEVLKLEIASYATMSPEIMLDGTVMDPEDGMDLEMEVDEE